MSGISYYGEASDDGLVLLNDNFVCREEGFGRVAKDSTYPERDDKSADIELFPMLPTELIILVFKFAAQESKAIAASLALVSHFARTAVLPLLFHTLILQQRTTVPGLLRFLHAHPRIEMHVRDLWMRQSTESDARLALPCARLERLAVTTSCFRALCTSYETAAVALGESTSSFTSLFSARELLLFPGRVRWDDIVLGSSGEYAHSFFRGITHLWLTQTSQLRELLRCTEATSTLSGLSHLASPLARFLVPRITVHDILDTFPSLHMLVIMPQPQHDPWLSPVRLSASAETEANSSDILCTPLDDRVYFLDAGGRKTEDLLFKSWRRNSCNIWTCAKPIKNLDR